MTASFHRLGLLAAVALLAAAPADPMLTQLDRLTGTWDSPGTMVDSAYSKAGTAQGTWTCSWSNDGVFLICDQSVTMNGTPGHDVAIYTYDAAGKRYRFYHVNTTTSGGSDIVVTPDSIVYRSDFTDGSRHVLQRTLNLWRSAGHYAWRAEYSLDEGKTWILMGSGTATRR